MAIASTSYACGSRTIRVARKSVHPPQVNLPTAPASPSSSPSPSPIPLSAPSSPSDESHLPPPSPPPSPVSQHVPETPLAAPTQPSPIPEWSEFIGTDTSSSPTHTYTPGEPYAPVSTSTAPFYPLHDPYYPIIPEYPPMYHHEWAWYPHPHDPTPPHHAAGASTSAAPPPPTHEDPAVSVLIDQASDHEIRLDQLELTVEHMTGSTHYEEMEQNLLSLEDRVHLVEHRTQTSLPEYMQMLESRLIALEKERDVLRARVQALEKTAASTSRAAR